MHHLDDLQVIGHSRGRGGGRAGVVDNRVLRVHLRPLTHQRPADLLAVLRGDIILPRVDAVLAVRAARGAPGEVGVGAEDRLEWDVAVLDDRAHGHPCHENERAVAHRRRPIRLHAVQGRQRYAGLGEGVPDA